MVDNGFFSEIPQRFPDDTSRQNAPTQMEPCSNAVTLVVSSVLVHAVLEDDDMFFFFWKRLLGWNWMMCILIGR